jgi:hypothetical protein
VIGDKYRRCYLAKEKVRQEQVHERPSKKLEKIEVLQKPTRLKIRGSNIECPRCHQNGVLNIAVRNQDPALTTFYVKHEKLGGIPWGRGKNKVDRVRRCYIGKQNVQQLKSI